MCKKIGYARVSTEDQKLDLQMSALTRAECANIFCDHGVSGRTLQRKGLNAAISTLEPGDTLVVWRLDRLGRSLSGLVLLLEELGNRNIGFCSLSESIDTNSSGGRLIFHMMAALAEFERSLISERTRAGMLAAKQNGKHVGRRPSLSNGQVDEAIAEMAFKGKTISDIATKFEVSRRSLKRLIQKRQSNI
ncbi:recombinase family protein [Bosea sp. (in: a-proteobacteria)]|jgi:DNA invertase Pin-like site-specific DNA recombinase|uniref:recombinase family protein n=1 Tax=Bosea sp. (in: a-proteobacteria) TaxID=1871050 RepID=UPI002DDD679A|nr:recombinase family protein [Bosea sp. (in: a-proteobacteria)]HEV2512626.1 recombinase family protein [Bosea sp. (in: a-proteobacteria)]